MKREIYDECHGMEHDIPDDGEIRCTRCGDELLMDERVFVREDADGKDIVCEKCMKKMSFKQLIDLFDVEFEKVRNL